MDGLETFISPVVGFSYSIHISGLMCNPSTTVFDWSHVASSAQWVVG